MKIYEEHITEDHKLKMREREIEPNTWIDDGCITKCDQCGEQKGFPHWKFCPNCGAVMSESLKGKYYGKLIVEGLRAGIESDGELNG